MDARVNFLSHETRLILHQSFIHGEEKKWGKRNRNSTRVWDTVDVAEIHPEQRWILSVTGCTTQDAFDATQTTANHYKSTHFHFWHSLLAGLKRKIQLVTIGNNHIGEKRDYLPHSWLTSLNYIKKMNITWLEMHRDDTWQDDTYTYIQYIRSEIHRDEFKVAISFLKKQSGTKYLYLSCLKNSRQNLNENRNAEETDL